ncbi:hypothetical protein QUF58_12350 [Anaerolineales bacterium HSG24]|nr:hypothetical protein [Anaerolineales bacterium HSG24]
MHDPKTIMNQNQIFWASWKAFGHFLGNILGRIAMTIFYFTILVPYGIGVRLFSDPLQIKTQPNTLWRPRATGDKTLQDIKRQY